MTGSVSTVAWFRPYVRPAAWGVIVAGVLSVLTSLTSGLGIAEPILSLLMLAGSLALLASGDIGAGRVALVATLLTAAGWVLFVLGSLIDLSGGGGADALPFSIGMLALLIGYVVTGVAAFRARKWTGWRPFTPLAVPVLLVVLIVLLAASGPGGRVSAYLGWWGLSFIPLGYAMLKS